MIRNQRGSILVPLALIVFVVGALTVGYFYWQRQSSLRNRPLTWEECVTMPDAKMLMSYPGRCLAPDGRSVTQPLSEQEKKKLQPPTPSGISGKVVRGPIMPVCRVNQPCEAPYQTTIIIKDQSRSSEITRFTSSADGTFSIPLPPGTYLLEGATPVALGGIRSQTVTVEANKFTEVIINFDTGIR